MQADIKEAEIKAPELKPHPKARPGSIVFPTVLIAIGIVFLLGNMGIVTFDIWFTLLRLWPVLLIAAGLDILIGRRSLLGSFLVVVVLLGGLAVAVALSMGQPATGLALTSEDIRQPLGDSTLAVVDITPGLGELRLSAGNEGANLIEGRVALAEREKTFTSFRQAGSTAYYTLRSEGNQTWVPGWRGEVDWSSRTWDLKLNRDVPIDLRLKGGVGRATLDLSRVKVTRLRIESGVGQTTVTLPMSGEVRAEINGGVGEMIVNIPAGMAARIEVDRGLSGIDISDVYRPGNDRYQSANYSTAANRVELTIKGGLGHIAVREIAEQ